MKDRLHSEVMSEQFRVDPFYAEELLADVLRDGSPAELAILLRHLSSALGEGNHNPIVVEE
nr:hypothetical protein [Pseudomonas lutea]